MITIPDFRPDGKDPWVVVVNVGNTHTRFGWFEGRVLRRTEAWGTSALQAAPPDLPAGIPVVVVSVGPAAAAALLEAWRAHAPRLLTAASSGLAIRYRPPGSLGADRLANARALLERGLAPGIAVDCGTATTLTVVDAAGTVLGGAIAPGLGTAAAALVDRTAQLPEVPLVLPEEAWGEDTATCLQLGMVEGHVGLIAHLVERIRRGLGAPAPAVLCGGWATTVAPGLPGYECAPYLTLEGARSLGELV